MDAASVADTNAASEGVCLVKLYARSIEERCSCNGLLLRTASLTAVSVEQHCDDDDDWCPERNSSLGAIVSRLFICHIVGLKTFLSWWLCSASLRLAPTILLRSFPPQYHYVMITPHAWSWSWLVKSCRIVDRWSNIRLTLDLVVGLFGRSGIPSGIVLGL